MNMSFYKDVVSNTRKYTSSNHAKKYIQVFVSNLFHHKRDENKTVYVVMTNFCEFIWYMKSDFIISCLVGMKKPPLFMLEYKDTNMPWIDKFTDFSVLLLVMTNI